MLQFRRVNVRHGCLQVRIKSADIDMQTLESAFGVELLRWQCGICIAKGLLVRGTQSEDWSRGLAAVEGWEDGSRRIPSQSLIQVAQCRPIVKKAGPAFDQPTAIPFKIPCDARPGAENVCDGSVQRMMMNDEEAIANLLLLCLPGPHEEIRKDRLRTAGIGIAIIVPTQPIVQNEF